MSAGYSGTPLVKKLGIKPGFRMRLVNPPDGYARLLGTLPEGALVTEEDDGLDFVHVFVREAMELAQLIGSAGEWIKPHGMIWISWPKQSSPLAGELKENAVREIGLQAGLVDVKVAAIDEDWSGLKFVVRLRDRPLR